MNTAVKCVNEIENVVCIIKNSKSIVKYKRKNFDNSLWYAVAFQRKGIATFLAFEKMCFWLFGIGMWITETQIPVTIRSGFLILPFYLE
jgi:hypothetical protein